MRRPLSFLALAAVACSTPAPSEPPARTRPAHLKALAWRCTDLDVVFFPGEGGRGRLKVLEETRDVALRPTASGFEYGDDQIAFRMIDDEAKITLADVEQTCLFDAVRSDFEDARVRGVAFRAIGKGFVVEITDVVTLARDGETPVVVPATTPTASADGAVAWSGSNDGRALTVTATPATCFDRDNGFSSEWSVEVALDDKALQGCGERLAIDVSPKGATEVVQ